MFYYICSNFKRHTLVYLFQVLDINFGPIANHNKLYMYSLSLFFLTQYVYTICSLPDCDFVIHFTYQPLCGVRQYS